MMKRNGCQEQWETGGHMWSFRPSWLMIIALLVSGVGFVAPASAQRITRAAAVSPHADRWEIWVSLDRGFDAESGKDLGNYILLEVHSGKRLDFVDKNRTNDPTPSFVSLVLDPGVRLQPTHYYHLYILNLTFGGKPPSGPLQSPVKFGKTDKQGNVSQVRSLEAADGRDDANYYFSGEVTRTRGEDFQGSVDVKVEYPFMRTYWGRVNYFGPSFDFKSSNDPKGDPDSMNLGFWWRARLLRLSVPFRYLNWRNSPKIEANRDFKNANFTWESRFSVLSKVWFTQYSKFFFQPFVGVEVGRNLRSPVPEAAHRFLSRPQLGTSANLIFPLGKPGLTEISLEASQIRRWPLQKEVSFKTDSAGALTPLPIGTSPRDYVTVKLNLVFLQGFGSTIGYEWGELPPSFNLVDHKLSIGLTYKAKVRTGKE
jgi:hypothetical protein